MTTIRDFFSILDSQTLIVSALALGGTYACRRLGIDANIPTGLIGLAVVFPIVFSINAAYRRREEALKSFAGIKAHAVALYWAHRDWVPGTGGESHAARVRSLIDELFVAIKTDLSSEKNRPGMHQHIMAIFSQFSKSHEALREAKIPSGEISRANQFMSKIMTDYERMRNIASYRTPVCLRAYSRVFLNLFPLAFAPYFAHLSNSSEGFPYVGYVVALLYSLVLVSLDNIQEALENPFDGVGSDDVVLNADEEYRPIIAG